MQVGVFLQSYGKEIPKLKFQTNNYLFPGRC